MRKVEQAQFDDEPGTFCHGTAWAFGVTPGHLRATVTQGRVLPADMKDLATAWERAYRGRHFSLMDLTGVTEIPPETFPVLRDVVGRGLEQRKRSVSGQAVVLTLGAVGMLIRGYLTVFHQRHPLRLFETRDEALRWLGCTREAPALAELDVALGDPVSRLRGWLRVNPTPLLTLENGARAAALSARSLQRHLKLARTSFTRELNAALMEKATQLLAGGASVGTVARELGFGLSSFTSRFTRTAGVSPRRWRAEQAGATRTRSSPPADA